MLVAAPLVAMGLRLLVEGTCPSAAAVATCLTPLLPPSVSVVSGPAPVGQSTSEPELRASVEPIDELLRVQVRDETGRLLSHNDLPRSATCDGLAAAAAIVILTAVTAQPQAQPPVLNVPSPSPSPTMTNPPPPPRVTLGVSALASVALTTASAAPGGGLDLQLATAQDTWGGRLLLQAHATRTVPIASGGADWLRLPVGLLARRRLHPASTRFVVDVSAGLWAAAVLVQGRGLAETARSLDMDLGLGGGLRVGRLIDLPSGQLVPTLELMAVGWLRRQNLLLQDEPQPVQALPAWDILLSVGLGWQRALP